MKLAVIFSGGKDSCKATQLAQKDHEVVCLLSIISENKDSYMFHTPNIEKTQLQAEAMNIPLVTQTTKGEKEVELEDLKALIKKAKQEFKIEGVVTGALASVYQATRVQTICDELELFCFNPLWQKDEFAHVQQLVQEGWEIYISAIAAYPLEKDFLGRKFDTALLKELKELQTKHSVSPSGEGGEFETFVASAPHWNKRIIIDKTTTTYDNHAGVWNIEQAHVEDKEAAHIVEKEETHDGNILLISTCQFKLHEKEFVEPIARIVGSNYCIKHYKELKEEDIQQAEKIIICGTALKDDEFLKANWDWVKHYKKPLLGICAGYQIIGITNGATIIEDKEIGMKNIENGQAYFLHHNNVEKEKYLIEKQNLKGVLFHPEVRQHHVVKDFLL